MKNEVVNRSIALLIIVLFIGADVIPLTVGMVKDCHKNASGSFYSENRDTEYWALIFAVGVYENAWGKNIPEMIIGANLLYQVLINSSNWQADHIHMVTGEEATGRRLIKELMWLIRNNDRNDMSLIYLTTHGGPLIDPQGNPVDLPPKDEADGVDEILVMHDGFVKWYAFIWDDLLNFFLSLLQSKGVCLIVDSCYAGGFNDPPMFTKSRNEVYTVESFSQGFAEELSTQNRVVLMACQENESEYGLYFTQFLIDGFLGGGDFWGNNDGINSAEEAYNYSEFWVKKKCDFTPSIFDLYPGEYPVTFSKHRVGSRGS